MHGSGGELQYRGTLNHRETTILGSPDENWVTKTQKLIRSAGVDGNMQRKAAVSGCEFDQEAMFGSIYKL